MASRAVIALLLFAVCILPLAAQDPKDPPIDVKFKGADIGAVLQFLSQVTGKPFIVHDKAKSRLTGKIDAYSDAKIPRSKVLDFIDTILRQKKLTTHRMDDVVMVIRLEDAENLIVQKGADPEKVADNDQEITQIIPVKNLRVADLDKNLKKIYPKNVETIADPTNNLLIMRGASQNIRRFLVFFTYLDQPGFGQLSIEMVKLENAAATDVANILNQIFSQQGGGRGNQQQGGGWWQMIMGGGGGGRGGRGGGRNQNRGGTQAQQIQDLIRIIPDQRTNSIIAAASDDNMGLIKKIINDLDQQAVGVSEIRIFTLKHASAQDVSQVMNDLFKPAGANPMQQNLQREMQRRMRWWGQQQEQGGDPSQTVRAIPDSRTNRLIVTATTQQMPLIEQLITELDTEYSAILKIKIIPLRHADATQLADVVTRIFEEEQAQGGQGRNQGGGGGGNRMQRQIRQMLQSQGPTSGTKPATEILRVVPDSRTNALIVSATEEKMAMVEKLILDLDSEYAELFHVEIVHLRYADSTELASVLTQIFEEQAQNQNQGRGGQGRNNPRMRQIIGGQPAGGNTPASDQVKIVADPRTNSLIVTASEDRLKAVKEMIAELDADILDAIDFNIYSLRWADPTRVATTITDIFNDQSQTGTGSRNQNQNRNRNQGNRGRNNQPTQPDAQSIEVKAIPDTRTNSVIVYCAKVDTPLINALVQEMDREVDELLKIKIYQLKKSTASEMASIINGLFTTQTQGRLQPRGGRGGNQAPSTPEGGVADTVIVQTDLRTNSLIVTASDDNLVLIDDIVSTLDTKPTEEEMTVVYKLGNANVLDVQEIIKGLMSGGKVLKETRGIPGVVGGKQQQQGQGGQLERGGIQVPGAGGGGRSRNLSPRNYFDGSYQDPAPQPVQPPQPGEEKPALSGVIDIQADPTTNTLFVRTSPRNLEALERIIKELDKFRPQVLIRALMIEVTLDESTEFGVEGFWENGITTPRRDKSKSRIDTTFGAGTGGFSYRLINDEFDIGLRALAEEGRLKVLATPRIFTLANQEASINVGKLVPFITSSRQTAEGNIINTIQYRDIGILLRVTPYISDDGLVTMKIHPEISEIASESEAVEISDGVTSPTFNQTAADATVAIRDGQTVVLGGLIREFEDEAEAGIPILKDIPLLGWLFSNTKKVKSRRELMFFITPHVVYTQQELEELTELEKAELKVIDPKDVGVKGREWLRYIRDEIQ